MIDKLWLMLIITISIFGIFFSKKINYKNYKIINIIKKLNFDNLFLALGTKMGVGTIIGTTMSIFIGGPGSILWIHIFTLLTSSIIYIESYLGSKYKQKKDNNYISGIYFYTKYGLKNNKLAALTLIIFILTYSFFFLMIQSNTIVNTLNINKNIALIIFLILLTLLITNNTNEIRKTLNKIVPFICMFFISISIYVVIKNIDIIPSILNLIIKNALSKNSFIIGLIIGIKRSIFLNELLIGTTSMASGINNEDKNITANTLVFGSYFIVFVVSTLVSFLILTYTHYYGFNSINYLDLLHKTFLYHFNKLGPYFLNLIITLLASSSIISGIYIGTSNIRYLCNNKLIIILFKITLIITITLGIFINTNKIWNIVDFMMLIIIIINLFIIYKLKDKL